MWEWKLIRPVEFVSPGGEFKNEIQTVRFEIGNLGWDSIGEEFGSCQTRPWILSLEFNTRNG